MRILVLSAHPDDETFGMGGTIKKYSDQGAEIDIFVISDGASAQYSDKKMIDVRRESCINKYPIVDMKIYWDQENEPHYFFTSANAVDGECSEDDGDCLDADE